MSLQNIPLRNFLIENFMDKLPKIHHQENIETTIIETDDFNYEEEIEEDTEEEIQYKYLDDDVLNQVFNYNNELTYNLHLCLFEFVSNTKIPFVQYYFIKNQELEFPKAVLDGSKFQINESEEKKEIKVKTKKDEGFSIMNLISFSKGGGSDKNNEDNVDNVEPEQTIEEDMNSLFKEQLFEFFKTITKYKEDDVKKFYRGFIQEKQDLFVFFDATSIEIPNYYELDLKNKKAFEKVIITDIIQNGHYFPISSSITNLFYQNSFLNYVKELDNSKVELPLRAYLCNESNEKYHNLYYENKEEELTIIYEKVNHPELDYIYVFSQEPISKDNVENIKSYALFVKKDIPVITETKEDLDLVKENIDDYNVFYFMKEGNKYFGVRNKMFFSEL